VASTFFGVPFFGSMNGFSTMIADEVGALLEVDHPVVPHADLVRVRVEPHVRAEGEDAVLDPPDAARADHGEVVRPTLTAPWR
jgi:hypothetical protein